MTLSKEAQRELIALHATRGVLNPKEVVDWARANPESALHRAFQWDDAKAADAYRVEQARAFIRLVVTVPEQSQTPIRMFVSLDTERGPTGGYRDIRDVLGSDELREQLIEQFLGEMQRFEARYRRVQELAAVFAALDEVKSRRPARQRAAQSAA